MSEPVLRTRFALHLRASGGSTYGDEIVDEAGKVVGYRSRFVSRNEKKHPSRTVYTLGDQEFVNDLEGFKQAYAAQLEQQKRDAEWQAAAPKAAR